ncbi:hypothetical protein AB6A23_27240 [Paenibacillus tarimensis]
MSQEMDEKMHKGILLMLIFTALISGCQSAKVETETKNEEIVIRENIAAGGEHHQTQVVIYELTDDIFQLPLTSIPYYKNGNITYLEDYVFEQHEDGHQPWLGTGRDVVTVNTSNLTGEDNPFLNLNYDNPKELKTPSGIVIQEQTNELINLIVPGIGTYEIELKSPPGTSVLFIKKITLYLKLE